MSQKHTILALNVAALMFHTLLALMTTVETLGIKSIATMAFMSSCQLRGF